MSGATQILGLVVGLVGLLTPAVIAQQRSAGAQSFDATPVKLVGEPVPLHAQIASIYGDVDGLTVTETEAGTEVRTAADVLFAFDSAELTGEAVALLAEAAGILADAAPDRVVVEGHTDGIGTVAYDDTLSLARAEAVVRELRSRSELGGVIFEPVGRGSQEPIAAEEDEDGNDLPDGRARNRRVELIFEDGPL